MISNGGYQSIENFINSEWVSVSMGKTFIAKAKIYCLQPSSLSKKINSLAHEVEW